MAEGDVYAGVQLGNMSAQWFIDHANDVTLLDGQHVYLDDNSGDFKKGDGSTLLGALPWITNTPSTINGGSATTPGVTIKSKSDTSANWASENPVLEQGEVGLETDTRLKKTGDGSTAWNSLDYDDGVIQTTGTSLTFSRDRNYGTVASPETGNITASTTGARLGVTNVIIHNHSSEPTFDSKFKKLSGSGDYSTGEINYIMCQYINSTEILYTISQRT